MTLFKESETKLKKKRTFTLEIEEKVAEILTQIKEILDLKVQNCKTYILRNYRDKKDISLRESYQSGTFETREKALFVSSLTDELFKNPEYTGKQIMKTPLAELIREPKFIKIYDYNNVLNLFLDEFEFTKNKEIKNLLKYCKKTRFYLIKMREKQVHYE
ncbi:MAG: hypothetical protein ACI4QE_03195 [Acutalibacteraceae bacterium]